MNLRNRNGLIVLAILVFMFLSRTLSGGFGSFADWLYTTILTLPGIIVGLSVHEFGHAFMSDRLGDPTPRMQGRLTLNPMAHFDLFGFVCLIFAGFGWGVPVTIDPRNYKHPRRDEFLVSIAGVVMNLITACVFAFVMHFMIRSGVGLVSVGGGTTMTLSQILLNVFNEVVIINISLMVFNLIPIPPLDGFGIITQIFNLRKYSWYYPLYQNGFLILMIAIMFNLIDFILRPGLVGIYNLVYTFIIM